MTPPSSNSTERIADEWTTGSYSTLERTFLPIAARLVDAAAVESDDSVLDVACGTGNVAITAARRGADVTGLDITQAMLETARGRADVLDLDVEWQEANAESLPFADDAFDATLSCLGHIFAEDPDRTAAELLRVTRPGGPVAFTAWTPTGAIAAMMSVIAEYLPPDPSAPPPPFLWGDVSTVEERFGKRVESVDAVTDAVAYPVLSPGHFWNDMVTDSGPVIRLLEEVDDADLDALRAEAIEALAEYFSDATNALSLEYRLVTATVR